MASWQWLKMMVRYNAIFFLFDAAKNKAILEFWTGIANSNRRIIESNHRIEAMQARGEERYCDMVKDVTEGLEV